jgi:cobalamin biosynthesis protein CobT
VAAHPPPWDTSAPRQNYRDEFQQEAPAKLQALESRSSGRSPDMRSLAKMPAIEVAFVSGRVWFAPARAQKRLPEPSRRVDAQEAAILRGHADRWHYG